MSKDVHNMDEVFRNAMEEQQEAPSAFVKENLFAQLDKRDAVSYKKRFIDWRRAAILLLFLLLGFVLYESLIKTAGTGDKKNITNENSETRGKAQGTRRNDDKNNDKDKNMITREKASVENNNTATKRENITDQSGSKDNDQFKTSDNSSDKIVNNDLRTIASKNRSNQSITSKENNLKTTDPFTAGKTGNETNPLMAETAANKKKDFHPQATKMDIAKITNLPLADLKLNKTSNLFNAQLANSIFNKNSKRIHHFKPYWLLTALATYDQVNYKLDSDVPNAITSIRHQEDHEPSFSASILATRQFKEKWGLQTGLIYSNVNIGISQQKLVALQDPSGDIAYKYITSSGYTYFKPGFGPPPAFGDVITAESKHRIHSVNVPLMLKYTIGKNKLLFVPGAGIEAGFITGSKLEIEIEDTSNKETVFINKLSGTKSFYWSFVADAEIRYGINQKMALSLRPVFRYAISPITENNVVETFPYSFGASLGLTYKF